IKEDVRDARGTRALADTSADVRYAVRTLVQRPLFTLVAVLTIAIGIGGSTAVFSVLDAVVLRPLAYRDPGQLVRVYKAQVDDPGERSILTPVHFLAYRDRLSSLQSIAAMNLYDKSGADIGTGGSVQRIRTEIVSADYFDVLRTPPMLGRPFTRDEERGVDDDTRPGAAVVILSNALWRERFGGKSDAIGKSLVMNGVPHVIVGVMPPGFADPILGTDVDAWVPLNTAPGRDRSNADNHYLSVIGRLAPGVSIGRAQAELDGLSRRLSQEYAQDASKTTARLYPLKEDLVSGSRGSLLLIAGAVGLVLLLVCVNIANLLLVRGSERARELAMRAALGARGTRLVRQMLVESLVLAAAGALASLPLAKGLLAAVVRLGGASVPRLADVRLGPPVLGFSIALTACCAVLFGMVPAWRAGRTEPADVLRGHGRAIAGDRAARKLRGALVISQIALAFVLLAAAGVLMASFRAMTSLPLGVHADNVFTFQVHLPDVRYDSTARAAFYRRLDAAINAIPGVKAAGATSRLPATGSYHEWGTTAKTGPLAGQQAGQLGAEQRIITAGYFGAVGIPIVAGRGFDDRDNAAAPDRVLLSANLAKALFPRTDPVGQTVRAGGRDNQVIGVVGDVVVDPVGTTPFYVYHLHEQFAGDRNWALFEMVATTGRPDEVAPAIHRALAVIDPAIVMDAQGSLDTMIGLGRAQRVFTLKVLMAFAVTALLLAALGVFGVQSYTVRMRRQEFGVRMALGATAPAIVRSVLVEALTVATLGIAVGAVGAIAASRVLSGMVFRVSPLDPVVLGGVALFVMIVSATAAWIPARRAVLVDPREVLE
ncbi:MAG: ADOP family duplicated permease, partial [Gemmatimonadales bacterium]